MQIVGKSCKIYQRISYSLKKCARSVIKCAKVWKSVQEKKVIKKHAMIHSQYSQLLDSGCKRHFKTRWYCKENSFFRTKINSTRWFHFLFTFSAQKTCSSNWDAQTRDRAMPSRAGQGNEGKPRAEVRKKWQFFKDFSSISRSV